MLGETMNSSASLYLYLKLKNPNIYIFQSFTVHFSIQ